MAKAETSRGSSTENQRTESAKRADYRAPKLTVVGTVHELTLGNGNNGATDGPIFFTQGGG